MDGPGTYGRLPWKGSSKDASGMAAEDTISIGSGDRVSGADRIGMEVHHTVCAHPTDCQKIEYYKSLIRQVQLKQPDCSGSPVQPGCCLR
jgi:hypothetical protein